MALSPQSGEGDMHQAPRLRTKVVRGFRAPVHLQAKASDAKKGFALFYAACLTQKVSTGRKNEAPRCNECMKHKSPAEKKMTQLHLPVIARAYPSTRIGYITKNPEQAQLEIVALCKEVRRLNHTLGLVWVLDGNKSYKSKKKIHQ